MLFVNLLFFSMKDLILVWLMRNWGKVEERGKCVMVFDDMKV